MTVEQGHILVQVYLRKMEIQKSGFSYLVVHVIRLSEAVLLLENEFSSDGQNVLFIIAGAFVF